MIGDAVTIRECATDAIRYWEPGRIIYNLVLAAIVPAYFVAGVPVTSPCDPLPWSLPSTPPISPR